MVKRFYLPSRVVAGDEKKEKEKEKELNELGRRIEALKKKLNNSENKTKELKELK
jgi:predicted RNase H-like nuclease (RuvC/YqgF family)